MEVAVSHIFTIIGAVILVASALSAACFGIIALMETYDRHKSYECAWRSMVHLREVREYCASSRPELADVLEHCEHPRMSASEFRRYLNKKYPLRTENE